VTSATETLAELHVAAAAIFDGQGRVLISQRPVQVHQGGLWEFPGGKLDPAESVEEALQRELQEELGIRIRSARPLIRVHHHYPDRPVLLDVWRIDRFEGSPHGREGQPVRWVAIQDLPDYPFPAANEPVIKAVSLPTRYLVTPEPGKDPADFLQQLAAALSRGVRLVQLRAKQLDAPAYAALARQAAAVCQRRQARLLLNTTPEHAQSLGADGVHLSSARLMALSARPLDRDCLVAGSCHSAAEVAQACALGLDFIVVSPVRETSSHPGARVLGFDGLRELTEQSSVPVYALGGMQEADLASSFRSGAQGIAAIRGLWH